MNAKVPMPKENMNIGRWRAKRSSCQVKVLASMSEVCAVESPTKNCRPMVEMAVTSVSNSGKSTIWRFFANSTLLRPSSMNITRKVAENEAQPRSGSFNVTP